MRLESEQFSDSQGILLAFVSVKAASYVGDGQLVWHVSVCWTKGKTLGLALWLEHFHAIFSSNF